jgi:two-component system, LytTR family, response regulator LytT
MQIVIIEDEKLTATDLAETILRVAPEARIVAMLPSVSSAIEWFQQNEHPDLIFSDIQLGDGLSFEIFKTIQTNTPVIFCTAYDEYALRAFDANGIDYILKPFDQTTVEASIQKYHKLQNKFSGNTANIEQLIQWMAQQKRPAQGSILVYKQDKILPVRFDDIALFYIENEITHLVTFDQKRYTINKTIENIEEIASNDFFRVNRQFLVHRRAIKEASHYFARKLSVTLSIPFQETITVSKNKVADFLNWLSSQ